MCCNQSLIITTYGRAERWSRCHFLTRVHVTSYSSTFASDKYQSGNKLPRCFPSVGRVWTCRQPGRLWRGCGIYGWTPPHAAVVILQASFTGIVAEHMLMFSRWSYISARGVASGKKLIPSTSPVPASHWRQGLKVYYEALRNKIWPPRPGTVSATECTSIMSRSFTATAGG